MDGQMLRCTELDPQLGHVGEIVHVDATLIGTISRSRPNPFLRMWRSLRCSAHC